MQIDKMLKMEYIQPAETEWAAVIMCAPKMHGSVRFCVSCRKLIFVAVSDFYSSPRMNECIDSLCHVLIFFTLDAKGALQQVEIDDVDRDKLLLSSHHRRRRFSRLVFELCNAPGTFQRMMNGILLQIKWKPDLMYLNDITICLWIADEHISQVFTVMPLLNKAGVTQIIMKCNFITEKDAYLGHVICPGK